MSEITNPVERVAAQTAVASLAVLRMYYGPKVAEQIEAKPPEERTWGDAAKTAAVAATDYADGWLTRRYGITSWWGALLDAYADKKFIDKPMEKLKDTGAIPAVYYYANHYRDNFVNGMRIAALIQRRSEDVAVGSAPKRKTALGMLFEAATNSPAAKNPDNVERIAAPFVALSVTTGVSYGVNYYTAGRRRRQANQPQPEEQTSRNSAARDIVAKPIDKLVTALDEKAPWLEADHLTLLGTAIVLGSVALAVKKPEKRVLATTGYIVGSAIDAIDGAKDRKKRKRTGEAPRLWGALLDSLTDRLEEIFIFDGLSKIARQRGNDVAADYYALCAMTSALPSELRASAESQGMLVAEGGAGASLVRRVLAGAGIAFNTNKEASNLISSGIAANNLITTEERYRVLQRGPEAERFKGYKDDSKFKHEAGIKRKALLPLAAAGVAVGARLLVKDRRAKAQKAAAV